MGDPIPNPVVLTAVQELRATPSYYWNAGLGAVDLRNPEPHVLRLSLAIDPAPQAPHGHTITREHGVLTPTELGRYWPNAWVTLSNPVPGGTGQIIWSPWADDQLDIHMAPDPQVDGRCPLAAHSVTVIVHDHDEWMEGTVPKHLDSWFTVTYEIQKLSCLDASLDSRVGYPNSNTANVQYGEGGLGNALPENLNFGPSEFRGGLFAGNMFWNGFPRDQSGTARIQLWPQGAPAVEDVHFASLALFDCGRLKTGETAYVASPHLGLYAPDLSDPQISQTEGSAVWDTRWTITPRTTPQSPYPTWMDPLDHKQLGSQTESHEYVSFNVSRFGAPYAPPLTAVTPADALQYLCLALYDESQDVLNESNLWAYFASHEYQARFPSIFPENDSAPRVWIVKNPTVELWTEGN